MSATATQLREAVKVGLRIAFAREGFDWTAETMDQAARDAYPSKGKASK